MLEVHLNMGLIRFQKVGPNKNFWQRRDCKIFDFSVAKEIHKKIFRPKKSFKKIWGHNLIKEKILRGEREEMGRKGKAGKRQLKFFAASKNRINSTWREALPKWNSDVPASKNFGLCQDFLHKKN